MPQAGTHPLGDQTAPQLSDGADDDDHRPAQMTTRVDVLAKRDELDLKVVQLVQNFQKVANRARQLVEGPDQYDIDAAASVLEQIVEPRAARLRAADVVAVLGKDLKATLLGQCS